jgi:malto-oligosyltrehalose trehalohydrolase
MSELRRYDYGPRLRSGGGAEFRLFAPGVETVALALEGRAPLAMRRDGAGWFAAEIAEARPGTRYRFRLPDGLLVPDPGSRFQPLDVHGPSELIDPDAYAWSDQAWRGRPWREAVVYELHVGAFTPQGTFRAAIERLPHLTDLGVTALEIMPVADFPGRRNWGYDGVLAYAPDASYGRPEDFKALVDAAHGLGLMVLLDVVYNHFGPDGNYLPTYAPVFFTDRHKTPWGAAINYDGPDSRPVREFVIQNALYWLEEFHLDGLRLDAVHAIVDDSDPPLLRELAERVRGAGLDRPVHLVLENEHNEARWLARRAQDGAAGHSTAPLYTAQWNDDLHHVLHVAATGEDTGYYADYLGDAQKLGRALAEGFAFQGEVMGYRGGPRGERCADLPPEAFVGFIQNHDQIGNRAFGERLTRLARPEALRALAAVYLLLPQVPMLFMGEEWGCERPFPFFCDFQGELGEAVREGRREEFKRFPQFQDPQTRARIPDPQAEATFLSAKLDWETLSAPRHAATLEHYRRLLAARRAEIAPLMDSLAHGGRYEVLGPAAVRVTWGRTPPQSAARTAPPQAVEQLESPLVPREAGEVDRGEDAGRRGRSAPTLTLLANLSAAPALGPPPAGRELWREGEVGADGRLGPWAVRWALED